MSEGTERTDHTGHAGYEVGSEAVQLRLLSGHGSRREWTLDDRTRAVGRQGVAQAKEILRRADPPLPAERRYTKAS